MNNQVISVIVAIYNVKDYLEDCLKTIVNQTYKDLEIILVDDGSTDGSEKVCDEFAHRDCRIKVIHKQNEGLVRARKTGLNCATGSYVVFIDGDDYIEADLCEEMLTFLLQKEVDFIHADYFENNTIKNSIVENKIYNLKECRHEIIKNMIFVPSGVNQNVLIPCIWTKISSIELAKKCYEMVPDNQSLGEDLIYLCYLIMSANRFAVVEKAFYHYRIRQDSMSHVFGVDMISKQAVLYTSLKQMFIEYEYPHEVLESLDEFFLNHIIRNLDNILYMPIKRRRFYFDNVSSLFGKSILLYGAGSVGKDYYEQLCRYEDIKIVDWVDKNSKIIDYPYRKVKDLSRIEDVDYDLLLVCVYEYDLARDIIEELALKGIDRAKIIWRKPDWR